MSGKDMHGREQFVEAFKAKHACIVFRNILFTEKSLDSLAFVETFHLLYSCWKAMNLHFSRLTLNQKKLI